MDRRTTQAWLERLLICDVRSTRQMPKEQVRAGWIAGYRGEPCPDITYPASYWHGWRCGRVDGGHDDADLAMAAIMSEQTGRIPRE